MRFRAVADVLGEAVFGVSLVELRHQIVAVGFGDDRSGGDGGGNRVAVNDGFLRQI